MKYTAIAIGYVISCLVGAASAQTDEALVSAVWVADNNDGTYTNPILHADYSDPDVVRVDDDYYLTASSFDAIPGLPVLHSRDLVNWTIAGHALRRQLPYDHFSKTQHGNGVWAPSIRYHNGEYYIFWGDPDFGIYRVKTTDPRGEWEQPVLLESTRGIIDVCPLWDDDGQAYLVYAYAGSRAGIKSILAVKRMDAEATRTLDEGTIIYDGHGLDPTIEGPKWYKRNGYYYIFAPAGGVATGWQTVLRAKNIYGPYERRIVLHQGNTAVNGPHQGGWVKTQSGDDWFIHFQDKGVYGRVTHLQPITWIADWPVIGQDSDNNGIGEPVLRYRKPNVGKAHPIATPAESDEFDSDILGLQWQWQANPRATWSFLYPEKGVLRLYAQQVPEGSPNLYETPNVLMQKFPAPSFTATAKVEFSPHPEKILGEEGGLVVMGRSYAALCLRHTAEGTMLVYQVASAAHEGKRAAESVIAKLLSGELYLRVRVADGGLCQFAYSPDGVQFQHAGEPFQAVEGHWIGAKMGFYCIRKETTNDAGWLDIDWFRVDADSSGETGTHPPIDSIAERMLLLQRPNGGWSKSFRGKAVDYEKPLSSADSASADAERKLFDTTIDNGSTTREIKHLVRAFQQTGNERYAVAARRGVDYLLEAQYDDGGWPQYYPDKHLYRSQITFNDNAIINVLDVLKAIVKNEPGYPDVFGDDYRARASSALGNGINCILETQLSIEGKLTIWAAQYDKDTKKPAKARAYELPSLAAAESAMILMFLMDIESPTPSIKEAVEAGVAWFREHGMAGYDTEIVEAPDQPTGKDRVLVKSPGTTIWARFYDLENQQPFFVGRDGIPHTRLENIENERRVGYGWYGTWGKKVIQAYEKKWQKKHGK